MDKDKNHINHYPPADREIICTENLSVGYQKSGRQIPVLDKISVTASAGELISLIGRNGTGKSTLLRTLMKIQPPLAGDVFISSGNLAHISSRNLAKKVSYVSTEYVRVSNMTVKELIALGRHPYTNWLGGLSMVDRHKIEEAMELVGISHLYNSPINEISDGERQKAMIARTIAQDSDIIILDEPTAYLDMPNRYELVALLSSLTKNHQKTILFSTHDLNIAMSVADKLWLIHSGKIQEGAPEDLAINGSFHHMLQDASLRFNEETGDFDMPVSSERKIICTGTSKQSKWTCRMLKRLHFDVQPEGNNIQNEVPVIDISEKNGIFEWTFIRNLKKIRFSTLYELAEYLKNDVYKSR